MELRCTAKMYDWGQIGRDSLVAKIAEKNDPAVAIEEEAPYAEFWMGTHPKGESIIKDLEIPLQQYIDENPECLGRTKVSFGTKLPFLLKVLSIRKALSLQVHPNKETAIKLHNMYPKMYTDGNHKPELAVALTDFEALCGFRPLEEISIFLQSIPELSDLVDPEYRHKFILNPSIKLLEKCFSSYITANPVDARKCSARLVERLSNSVHTVKEAHLSGLFLKINKQFPGDIGLFSIYFLNYLSLKRGEAIFLDAGLPHAYLQGDCVEVMACSDNVVRAGLTPKVRDVATLKEIVKYDPVSAEDIIFKKRAIDKFSFIYKPPVQDFALTRIKIPENESYTIQPMKQASILIVIDGKAESECFNFRRGLVLFLPCETALPLTVTQTLEMYQAYANI